MEATSFNAARLRCLHIGFLFQSFFLLEEESALANVLAPARIAGRSVKPGSESHERGLHLLEMTGMTHRSDFPVKYLSGGEKQRIGLARALGNNPDILLADEPTGNLDDATAAAIYALMWEATIAQGKGLIVVTHDKRLSDRCDRTLFLHKGRLYPNQEF
jgi:predicted ABC-type transport system involved in lysophospholipase L1 biosynthesis ATPase subunit